jgi:hypothetical protein
MTGFKINDEWLEFNGEVALEIRSPLFDAQSVPGILSYPASFADTPHNRRVLGFPAHRPRLGTVALLDAQYYIGGVLWREGTLRYQEYDSQAREYTYQFEADADALASRIDGVMLDNLLLPVVTLELVPETADYVLAPVRNNVFYDAEKNPDWCQVVNYFSGGGALQVNFPGDGHTYTAVPFLKVVPLLQRALGKYGYTVSGPWLDDAEIQQLVLYSTRAMDQETGPEPVAAFALDIVLPNVRLADLLLALQQLFCITYVFSPTTREVSIVPLRDVVADPGYLSRRPRAGFRDKPGGDDGFLLSFSVDGSDELLAKEGWPTLTIGNGKETIQPAADTLTMVREDDPTFPGRQWLVPAAEQQGYSIRTDFEQAKEPLDTLRFLFYRGLQRDSLGNLYPLASSGTTNYNNETVGNYALTWAGPQGLYEQWHKPWLDFRQAARIEERAVHLTVGEFQALDPTRKDMIAGLKFLWERISITAGGNGALSDATITYHQIEQ